MTDLKRRPTILHLLGWYFPDSSGGTEVYVEALTRHLRAAGIDSRIAAATDQPNADDYEHGAVPVHRYPVPAASEREIADGHPHERFDEFARWLTSQHADIYHQHSWTRGCGLPHLLLAKALGFKTVVTVHVPSVICLRGTMMLNGEKACDGRVEVERCTECWGSSRGIPRVVGGWQGRNPHASEALGSLVPLSRLQTALLTPRLVARRQEDLRAIAATADRIVAVCRWLDDALALNDFPREKLVHCAQAVDASATSPSSARERRYSQTLRVGFLGRWDPVKGVHVLVDAFRQLPGTVDAELIVHGLPGDRSYEQSVRAQAAGDRRIQIMAPLDRDEVLPALAGFDLLAVPSMWLETGPLVVLEAFAAGTPVIGSNLGGIAELVTPGVNGVLVAPGDVPAWIRALSDFAQGPRQRVSSPPRSSAELAHEMVALYRGLLANHQSAAVPADSQWARSAF